MSEHKQASQTLAKAAYDNDPTSTKGLFVDASGFPWTNFTVDYPSATQEVYKFYNGAVIPGNLVRTITLDYTDATKEFLASGGKA